jgi:hypothetical protein
MAKKKPVKKKASKKKPAAKKKPAPKKEPPKEEAKEKLLPDKPLPPKIAKRADQVLEELVDLAKKRHQMDKDIAERLFEVAQGRYYKHYTDEEGNPFKTFDEFVKGKLSIDLRKAYALKRVWQKLHLEAGLDWKEVKKIPWTKADVIADEVTPENVDEWKDRSKKMTVPELRREVKTRKKERQEIADKGEEPEDVEFDRHIYHMTKRQKEAVDVAIEKAGGKAKSDKAGHVVSQICAEWLGMEIVKGNSHDKRVALILSRIGLAHDLEIFAFRPGSKDERETALNDVLDNVEETFGVKVEIVEDGEDEEDED